MGERPLLFQVSLLLDLVGALLSMVGRAAPTCLPDTLIPRGPTASSPLRGYLCPSHHLGFSCSHLLICFLSLSPNSFRFPLAAPSLFPSLGLPGSVAVTGVGEHVDSGSRVAGSASSPWRPEPEPRGVKEWPHFSTLPWQPWSSLRPASLLFTGLFCSVPITFSCGCLILSFLSV